MYREFLLWCSRLRIQYCLCGGVGSIPGPGLCGTAQSCGSDSVPFQKLPYASGAMEKKKKIIITNTAYIKNRKAKLCSRTELGKSNVQTHIFPIVRSILFLKDHKYFCKSIQKSMGNYNSNLYYMCYILLEQQKLRLRDKFLNSW